MIKNKDMRLPSACIYPSHPSHRRRIPATATACTLEVAAPRLMPRHALRIERDGLSLVGVEWHAPTLVRGAARRPRIVPHVVRVAQGSEVRAA